jgi:putative sigma-54 modulation protein
MQITISTRHGQLLDETRRQIHEKAEKLLHVFDRLTIINVTADQHDEVDRWQVEILASAEHKHDFVAREAHSEVLAAMDLALDKIRRQLRDYKERIQDHRRDPSAGDLTGR